MGCATTASCNVGEAKPIPNAPTRNPQNRSWKQPRLPARRRFAHLGELANSSGTQRYPATHQGLEPFILIQNRSAGENSWQGRGLRRRPYPDTTFTVLRADHLAIGGVANRFRISMKGSRLLKRPSRGTSPKTTPIAGAYYEHPLVAPQVSHFSQVPLRTIVKFWHSVHILPV